MVFERFVDATEPICQLLDPKKSGYLIYDPTGVEAYVKETIRSKRTNMNGVRPVHMPFIRILA